MDLSPPSHVIPNDGRHQGSIPHVHNIATSRSRSRYSGSGNSTPSLPPVDCPPPQQMAGAGIRSPPPPPMPVPIDPHMQEIYNSLRRISSQSDYTCTTLQRVDITCTTLSGRIDALATRVDQAGTVAQQARDEAHAIRQDFAPRLTGLEERIASLEQRPSANPASAHPPNGPIHGNDFIELKIVGWPDRTRTEYATPFLEALGPKVQQFSGTPLLPSGNYCGIAKFRFPTFAFRKACIAELNSNHNLDFVHNGVTTTLVAKSVTPADVAKHTDVIASSAYWFHKELEGKINHKKEVLTNYRNRELCLFDRPIVYYCNPNGQQIFTREGGLPCLDRSCINALAAEKRFAFDCEQFVQWITAKYVERQFIMK